MKRFYFDWAASAPPAFPPLVDVPFGNPSSQHTEGCRAAEALQDARRRSAAALSAPEDSLYWTSGATESNAIVILSRLIRGGRHQNDCCITSAVEHPSCLRNFQTLEQAGTAVIYLKPNRTGHIDEAALDRALDSYRQTSFVSIQWVNSETGAIQDIPRLCARIRARASRPVHLHSDCVQALGKIPIALETSGLDSAAFSAHKIGGQRGIGLLYLKKPLEALVKGGGQEQGIRPGTENLAGALDFARCLEQYLAPAALRANAEAACRRLRRLLDGLCAIGTCTIVPACRATPAAAVHGGALEDGGDGGDTGLFSPYILSAALRDIPGEVMVRALDAAGYAVSTGSACSSARKKKTAFLAAGIDEKTAFETIRISQGFTTTEADIDSLCAAIQKICAGLGNG
ncbi:MAG: aminotransferase class V-fold PLP-dependent enzyme [Spirochaetaceae bacterium]|nr:aminotransferase class V-fold PLP-dependent enzyme [Spirochaetaceae bacterium]